MPGAPGGGGEASGQPGPGPTMHAPPIATRVECVPSFIAVSITSTLLVISAVTTDAWCAGAKPTPPLAAFIKKLRPTAAPPK